MLAPGHHLYMTSGGEWRYRAPGDVFVKINADPELLARLQQRKLGGDSGDSLDSANDNPVGLATLSSALIERGVLIDADSTQVSRPFGRVHIDGDNSIADQLKRLLSGASVKRGKLSRAAVEESEVVVTCAEWLPDSRWQEIDDWCRSAGTAWHMSYFEDASLAIRSASARERKSTSRLCAIVGFQHGGGRLVAPPGELALKRPAGRE